MNETKIIIEGMDYDFRWKKDIRAGLVSIVAEPRRKQTGWICRFCQDERCIMLSSRGLAKPEKCVYAGVAPFEPYYGEPPKVVDE